MYVYICVYIYIHTHIYTHTERGGKSYWNDLQAAVQLIQQWAAVNGKSKNLVVAQFHEAGGFSWSSVKAGILKKHVPIDVLVSKYKQVKNNELPFPVSLCRPPEKLWPRLKLCTTTTRPKLIFTWNLVCLRLALNSWDLLVCLLGLKAWTSLPGPKLFISCSLCI